MDNSGSRGGRRVPNWHKTIESASKLDYILVQDLAVGDLLEVVTRNSRYAFRVLDPERRSAVMTSTNPQFAGPMQGCLQGSKLSPLGSSIFMGRVAVGLMVVFSSPELLPHITPEIDLSPTKGVFLNGHKILPVDSTLVKN